MKNSKVKGAFCANRKNITEGIPPGYIELGPLKSLFQGVFRYLRWEYVGQGYTGTAGLSRILPWSWMRGMAEGNAGVCSRRHSGLIPSLQRGSNGFLGLLVGL